jgi:hypothetical protein
LFPAALATVIIALGHFSVANKNWNSSQIFSEKITIFSSIFLQHKKQPITFARYA